MKKENMIFVIAQHFYGNGTGVTIRRDEVDAFLKGDLDCDVDSGKEPSPDRRLVPVPGNEHIVIVYDQRQAEGDQFSGNRKKQRTPPFWDGVRSAVLR